MDTPDNRDRLSSQRRVLGQAAVTTRLGHAEILAARCSRWPRAQGARNIGSPPAAFVQPRCARGTCCPWNGCHKPLRADAAQLIPLLTSVHVDSVARRSHRVAHQCTHTVTPHPHHNPLRRDTARQVAQQLKNGRCIHLHHIQSHTTSSTTATSLTPQRGQTPCTPSKHLHRRIEPRISHETGEPLKPHTGMQPRPALRRAATGDVASLRSLHSPKRKIQTYLHHLYHAVRGRCTGGGGDASAFVLAQTHRQCE